MKKILITGASGFFGKSVINALEKVSFPFKAICLYHSKKISTVDDRFSWVQADLLDHSIHDELMHTYKPTDLIHLAWDVSPGEFWHSMKSVDWLYASVSLFKEFCRSGGKKFIGAGSSTEYDWSSGILDEKSTPLKPSTLYGECKKSLHALLTHIQKKKYSETILIWARVGYFFGPNEPPEKLISKIISHLKGQIPLSLVASEISRPYAHVKYLGETMIFALSHQNSDISFNLSSSVSHTIKEIVEFIGEELQKSTEIISYGNYKSPMIEPKEMIFNTKILQHMLGYQLPDTFYEDLSIMACKKDHSD